MHSSGRKARANTNKAVRSLIVLIIVAMALPLTPAQAEAAGERARQAVNRLFGNTVKSSVGSKQEIGPQQAPDPAQLASRVTHIRLCPRRILLYVGETFTLVPMALDRDKQAVHGITVRWETNSPSVAQVSSVGEVTAVAAGNALVTVQAGLKRANVMVEVRAGVRPKQSDLEWDLEHANDCNDPDATASNESEQDRQELAGQVIAQVASASDEPDDMEEKISPAQGLKQYVRPAVLRTSPSMARHAVSTAASKKIFGRGFYQIVPIDGDSSDTFAQQAARFYNAIGSPRFSPQETTENSPTKTKKNLGSYNYLFTAPVLGQGGRGIGVKLGMAYNSRTWNKDGSTMTFNYNKGWPAAGWTLGYGRIIDNYDNSAGGDETGVGLTNPPGNRLLIQPDGTRVHLQQTFVSAENVHLMCDSFVAQIARRPSKSSEGLPIRRLRKTPTVCAKTLRMFRL